MGIFLVARAKETLVARVGSDVFSAQIISSSIIKYREPYGGGIVNLNWNDQFVGKDRNSDFEVGEDIQGISGATISVNSVTKGINKLCLLISEIKDSL